VGEQPILSMMNEELGIQIIAIKRRGIHYSEQKIGNLRLAVGDVLLVHCTRDKLDELRQKPDLVILEDVHHQIVNKRKAPLAILIFVTLVATVSTGLASIEKSAVTAVFAMVLTGCIQLRHAYRSIDAQILLLIVGTIALGTAMEKTGAAKAYAEIFLIPFQGLSPALILSALILMTIILTELMSNSATAVLLLPIAVSTAIAIGVNPKPFIIGICFGATCGFAIPIGYQTHLLVYGPGGYRSSDFLKLGLPIDLITWLMTSLLIPVFWPFYP
jgi:di/tricarboxylate transporter